MTQSRLDFEVWAKGQGYNTNRYFDDYYHMDTSYAWRGWSARDDAFLKLMEKK